MTTRVAAVDVGTNSVRLLIAEAGGTAAGTGPLVTLERHMRITRLGAGVDAAGRLDDTALARTLGCIDDYAARWRERGAGRVRICATSAIRDAADRDRFFDGVRDRTGVDAEVLSGEQEAGFAFTGATRSLARDGNADPYLVLDIGGGSTEFILGRDRPWAAVSRQLGCVRLTERCLHADPPTTGELGAATAVVDRQLDAVEGVLDPTAARTLVGVAGTVTTVAALHLGLSAYVPERIHGTHVPTAQVVAVSQRLAGMTSAERARLGPMAPGREDVIVAGTVILRRVLERFCFDEVVASEADMLDGLALGLLGGDERGRPPMSAAWARSAPAPR